MGNKFCEINSQNNNKQINKAYNILLVGPIGVGKTFLMNQLSAIRKYDQGGQLIEYKFYDRKGLLNQFNFKISSSEITKQDLYDIDGIVVVCNEDDKQVARIQHNFKKLIQVDKISPIPQYLIRTSFEKYSESRTQVSDQGEVNVRQTAISLINLINCDPSMYKTNEVKRTFLKIYENLLMKQNKQNKCRNMVHNKYSLIFNINLYENDEQIDDIRIKQILMEMKQFDL